VAQSFDFKPPASVTDAATPGVMRDLAERILPVYQEDNPERYLANLSALQLVAGNYTAAMHRVSRCATGAEHGLRDGPLGAV